MADVVLFPQVKVELVGEDGNAFAIIARATKAARKAGLPKEVIDQYRAEAMAGDYDNLLNTTMRYFDCDPVDDDSEEEVEEYWLVEYEEE